jgi:hypothetical protein
MKRTLLKTLVMGTALVGSLLVTPAQAALIIDDFTTGPGSVLVVTSLGSPTAAVVETGLSSGNTIGGSRSLSLTMLTRGVAVAQADSAVGGGTLSLGNTRSTANLTTTWNANGLGLGNGSGIALPHVVQLMAGSDLGARIEVTLTSLLGSMTVPHNLGLGTDTTATRQLLSYDFGGFSGLGHVTGISMTIFGNVANTDVSVYSVSAVPEISTWVAGSGMLGIMLLFGSGAHGRVRRVFRLGANNG